MVFSSVLLVPMSLRFHWISPGHMPGILLSSLNPALAVLLMLPLVVESMHCDTIEYCRHSWIGLLLQCPFSLVGFQGFSSRHMSSTVSLTYTRLS